MKEQSVSAKLYILNDFHTCLSEIECCKSISQIHGGPWRGSLPFLMSAFKSWICIYLGPLNISKSSSQFDDDDDDE